MVRSKLQLAIYRSREQKLHKERIDEHAYLLFRKLGNVHDLGHLDHLFMKEVAGKVEKLEEQLVMVRLGQNRGGDMGRKWEGMDGVDSYNNPKNQSEILNNEHIPTSLLIQSP